MYLDTIVDFINDTVKLRMGEKASRSKFYGVCKIVDKDGEKSIVYYDNQGQEQNVVDDTHHLIVYHRFLGFSFTPNEQNQKNSFGDGTSMKSAFANFIMGVYGNREALDMSDQDLSASIGFNFPSEMNRELTRQLTGIGTVTISPQQTTTSPTTEPIAAIPENIFFTVNYRIGIIGDVNCLSQCNPECV